ncbi:hypothetical protein [Psychromonas sp.]|uniref:hypothetical protein n=1 Tax=Psychromonas sp. TaxID=1884585 RepID=UPI0035643FF9
MSEYQYYEFRNLSGSLTRKQQQCLRGISSRASISAAHFSNEYHFGDLQADASDLMADFFDLGLYMANWGSAELYIKMPRQLLDEQLLQAFQINGIFEYKHLGENWLLHFALSETEDYLLIEGKCESWMGKLQALRDELYRGDYRCLYIIWLCAFYYDCEEVDKLPQLNAALSGFSEAQQAFAEFLHLDSTWLTALNQLLPSQKESKKLDDNESKKQWLSGLTEQQIQSTLLQLLNDNAQICQEQLLRAYQSDQQCNKSHIIGEIDPIVLQKCHQQILQQAQQQQEEIRQQQQKKRQVLRAHYLKGVYQEKEKFWQAAQDDVEKAGSRAYDNAAQKLFDLSQAYQLNQAADEFQLHLTQFMQPYLRKRAFIKGLRTLGLSFTC